MRGHQRRLVWRYMHVFFAPMNESRSASGSDMARGRRTETKRLELPVPAVVVFI